jgi:hypothetical protein
LCGDELEARKWPIFVTLFYPFAITTIAAGLLAFVLILLGVDPLIIATVVLWFYFASAAAIYIILRNVLKTLGLNRFFLGFTITIGVLAFLSAILLGLGISSRI